jgi:hypothetical protein
MGGTRALPITPKGRRPLFLLNREEHAPHYRTTILRCPASAFRQPLKLGAYGVAHARFHYYVVPGDYKSQRNATALRETPDLLP